MPYILLDAEDTVVKPVGEPPRETYKHGDRETWQVGAEVMKM